MVRPVIVRVWPDRPRGRPYDGMALAQALKSVGLGRKHEAEIHNVQNGQPVPGHRAMRSGMDRRAECRLILCV